MGFLDSFFGRKPEDGDGRFQTDEAAAENRTRQLAMTPQTVSQLRQYGVTDQSQLKLEYFFYTNTRR